MKQKFKKFLLTAILLSFCFGFQPANAKTLEATSAQIAKIETSLWGFEYKKEDDLKRLSRLENNVFGQATANLNIQERIDKLTRTLGLEGREENKKPVYEIDLNEVEGVEYPQIDKLETQLFKKNYKTENIYKRLERLENKIFGAPQEGDLSLRTDKLKAYLKIDATPQTTANRDYTPNLTQESYNYFSPQTQDNNSTYAPQRTPYQQQYGYPQQQRYTGFDDDMYSNSDIYLQISGLENSLFRKTFSQDPLALRLNRLERKIFQRDFSSDDDETRMQRLQAAASAQKTSKFYEQNKFQKYASTGIQIGSILLMILALIL